MNSIHELEQNIKSNFLENLTPDSTIYSTSEYLQKLLKAGRSIIPLQHHDKTPIFLGYRSRFGYESANSKKIIERKYPVFQNWKIWQQKQVTWPTLKKRIEEFSNFGEIPGYAGLTVLDLDVYKLSNEGKIAFNAWLNDNWHWIKKCPIHRTARGGYHIYTELDCPNNNDIWIQHNGLAYQLGEFRYLNYVCCPPSKIIDDNGEILTYVILQNNFDFTPQKIKLEDLNISFNAFKSEDEKPISTSIDSIDDIEIIKSSGQLNIAYPERYFEAALANNRQFILDSEIGSRNKRFNNAVFSLAKVLKGLNKTIKDIECLKDSALSVGLSESEVKLTFLSALKYGLMNSYQVVLGGDETIKLYGNHVITFVPNEHLTLDYIHYLLNIHSIINTGKRLRYDTKLHIILDTIYRWNDNDKWNGLEHYRNNGLNSCSPSCNQIAKANNLNPKTVNASIKTFEKFGILQRFENSNPELSKILIYGDELRGLYLECPVSLDERTEYRQMSLSEEIDTIVEQALTEQQQQWLEQIKINNEKLEQDMAKFKGWKLPVKVYDY